MTKTALRCESRRQKSLGDHHARMKRAIVALSATDLDVLEAAVHDQYKAEGFRTDAEHKAALRRIYRKLTGVVLA